MRDCAYTKYIWDVFVHDEGTDSTNPNSPRLTLLGFSAFDKATDACLYNWNSSTDMGVLSMGKVFAPSLVLDLQPTMILPNGKTVPNIEIRVRTAPIADPLDSLSCLWHKKLHKLIEKFEALYAGLDENIDCGVVDAMLDEKISCFACDPSEFVRYLNPSKAVRAAAKNMRVPGSVYYTAMQQDGLGHTKDSNTRVSTPDSFFSRGWGAANVARLTTPSRKFRSAQVLNPQKSPIYLQKDPIHLQKSPMHYRNDHLFRNMRIISASSLSCQCICMSVRLSVCESVFCVCLCLYICVSACLHVRVSACVSLSHESCLIRMSHVPVQHRRSCAVPSLSHMCVSCCTHIYTLMSHMSHVYLILESRFSIIHSCRNHIHVCIRELIRLYTFIYICIYTGAGERGDRRRP